MQHNDSCSLDNIFPVNKLNNSDALIPYGRAKVSSTTITNGSVLGAERGKFHCTIWSLFQYGGGGGEANEGGGMREGEVRKYPD